MISILKHKISYDVDYSSTSGITTFLNPFSYLLLRNHGDLLDKMDNIYIDGISLVVILKLVGIKTTRLGFDMTTVAPKIFKHCINEKKSIYFIGSKQNEIEQSIKIFKDQFPDLNIIGFRNGYLNSSQERANAINKINGLKPDVTIVGMGTPYQEQFLVDLKESGYGGIGFTCGGFLHQTTKGITYFPSFYNKYHLRWAYRMIDEPKLISRYFIDYPKAFVLLFFDILKFKFF